METEVSAQDKAFALEVIRYMYPNHRSEVMNTGLVDFAHRMLEKMYEASSQLDLVPRPAGWKPGMFYLFSQAAQILWRSKVSKSKKIYYITSTVLAWANKSEYHLLCLGDL